MKKIFWILIIFINQIALASYIGTYGETFKIAEIDLLEVIHSRLKNLEHSGELAKHQSKIQNKIAEQVKRPKPVNGIAKTKIAKTFWYDPSLKVPYDLKNHQGKVFAASGTVINPLDTHKLRTALLFIDGDDLTQVVWSLNYPKIKKIILINGSPFELSNKFKSTFYFDQNGKLVKKFGISKVPTKVTQDSNRLKIEEVVLDA